MSFRFVIGLVLSTLLFSCESESESPSSSENMPLVEINFTNYLANGHRGFLVITDIEGDVLFKKEFFNDEALKPLPEMSFGGEVVNVYIVTRVNSVSHTHAYLNVKRGSLWSMTPAMQGVNSSTKFKLNNIGTFDFLTYGTDSYGITVSSISDTTNRTNISWVKDTKAYAQIVRDGEGRYGFFDIDPTKKVLDLDYSALPEISEKLTINYPDIAYGMYSISGFSEQKELYALLFDRNVSGSEAAIYFPNLFNDYAQHLSFFKTDRYYMLSKVGSLVTEFNIYDADVTFSKRSPNDFSMSLTGDVDYYEIDFTNYLGTEYVHVYAPFYVTNFQIPDLSTVIDVPKVDFSKFVRNRISLTDIEGIEQKPGQFDFQYSTGKKNSMRKIVEIEFSN